VYLPLVLCLAFTSQPTTLLMQLPPASKTNAICVGLVLVSPPPVSPIWTSSVAGCHHRSFHLEVHPLPSIKLLGHRCCWCHCPMPLALIRRCIELVVGGRPLADAWWCVYVIGLVRNVVITIVVSLRMVGNQLRCRSHRHRIVVIVIIGTINAIVAILAIVVASVPVAVAVAVAI